MDRLVDHLFVFEGDGVVRDFPGNYTQYRISQKQAPEEKVKTSATETIPATANNPSSSTPAKRFSFKEKREFELLEKEIAALTKEKN